jgi:arylsulfatase A-like enzyme
MVGRIVRGVVSSTLLVVGMFVVHKFGGGADAPHGMPLPGGLALPAGLAKDPAREALQVRLRFLDALKDARLDVPSAKAGTLLLASHWRKMQLPWSTLPSDAAGLATSLALRTSATEVAWVMPKSNGGVWSPDARIWNMSEGSFDQREAIFAPTPSVIAFRVSVPANAKLSFAPATVNTVQDDTLFVVTAVDARGQEKEVCATRISSSEAKQWHDVSCALDAWSGQTIELRFKTSVVPAEAKPPVAPPVSRRHSAEDAGAPTPEEKRREAALTGGTLGLALWGNPTLLAKAPSKLPYNVLWIVVDALRPDVIASFHDDADDAKKRGAAKAPLDALLPKIPGLMPVIDDLATRGVRFTHAYSNGAWTRPGTLAMLSGARSTELGVDPLPWVLQPASAERYYRSDPPLLPLLLRREGAATRAFVNNYFMVGYAAVGVDMGFERVDDHRYRTRDTLEITTHAVDWLKNNGDQRFFVFCNYNSPHEPWEPPKKFQDRVPPPPVGPGEWIPRQYMAEAAKDDEAIGVLMKTLDELGLKERTLVVITADHGETLSSAHAGISKLDKMPVRYHHAVSNYEETGRVPILMILPGVLPPGKVVTERVRSVDLAPTVLDIEGLETNPKMSGRSLLPLIRGAKEAEERVVLTEGRGTRGFLSGKYRLLLREGAAQTTTFPDDVVVTAAEELYDLDADPGERRDLARDLPDVVAEMKARMHAATKNVPVAGSAASFLSAPEPGSGKIHLRFAGAGAVHRVSGAITVTGGTVRAEGVGVGPEAFKLEGARLELAFTTSPSDGVGFDLQLDPPTAKLEWQLFLDERPWPAHRVFTGPFGLSDDSVQHGLDTDSARATAFSPRLPEIDVGRDLGLFVTRDRRGETSAPAISQNGEGSAEMNRLLKEWGYAHGSGATAPKK